MQEPIIVDPSGMTPLRDILQLPEGWKAERYPCSTELTAPDGKTYHIANPYSKQSIDWWIDVAAAQVKFHNHGKTKN